MDHSLERHYQVDAFVTKLNSSGSALIYSTYLGGTKADFGFGIAVDSGNSAYVTGQTESTDFPVTPAAAFDTSLGGPLDGFVTKVNVSGSMLDYSTFLGGSSNDAGTAIAVDTLLNAHVTGLTLSTDFPTADPIQASSGGNFDAFVTKFAATGSALVYSTYLGGAGFDQGAGIALDALSTPNAYVVGFTGSADFPTTAGAFDTTYNGGTSDAFVAKIAVVIVPPPPTVGKVTGGGSIEIPDGIGTFGFIVQRKTADGPISGELQYVRHLSNSTERIHSVTFLTFVVAGNTATFSGECTNNGSPCTFSVQVTDNDEPGIDDTFTISVETGGVTVTEGGTLRSGNIQIHQ